MIAESRSLDEITERALDLLFQGLGAADAIRFLNQFSAGQGDYTALRQELFADLTLDQFFADVKEMTAKKAAESSSL